MLIDFLKYLYNYKLFKRVVPSIIRKIGGTKIVSIYNFKIYLSLSDSIEREIFLTNYYDKDRFEYLSIFINKYKFEYFFDIGSYIGFYSLFYSKYSLIPNVVAFEANKLNFKKLKKNILLNNANIETYNIALSNTKGEGKIWYNDIKKTGGSSIYSSSDNEIKKYDKSKILYDTVTLDTLDSKFSNLINKIILIKIDVERHELNVLDGSHNFLKNNKVLIQIEILDSKKNIVFDKLIENNFKYMHSIDDDYYFSNFIKF